MKILVGLGNPGKEYEGTRHNFGFMVVDCLVDRLKGCFKRSRFKAHINQSEVFGEKVLVVKPTTFMNLSGECVSQILFFYQEEVRELLVIVDDLDLPLGRIKFTSKGSSGGHKGVESIIQALGTNQFPRLKIGIGKPIDINNAADYVLSKFAQGEKKLVNSVLKKAVEALEFFLENDLTKTMNCWNQKPAEMCSKEFFQ